jgi:hypothetical protein
MAAWHHGRHRQARQTINENRRKNSVSVNMKDIGGNKHGGGESEMKNGGGGNNQREKSSGGDACPLSSGAIKQQRWRNGIVSAISRNRKASWRHEISSAAMAWREKKHGA